MTPKQNAALEERIRIVMGEWERRAVAAAEAHASRLRAIRELRRRQLAGRRENSAKGLRIAGNGK